MNKKLERMSIYPDCARCPFKYTHDACVVCQEDEESGHGQEATDQTHPDG